MKKYLYPIAAALLLTSCQDQPPMVGLGLDPYYSVPRMQKLVLDPGLAGDSYEWTINGVTVSHSRSLAFVQAREGTYNIGLRIDSPQGDIRYEGRVQVVHEDVEYTPYISRVYEYCPAPGQYVNELPQYEPGDTYGRMLEKVEQCIAAQADVIITLGAWGGYVTFGFDHTVVNVPECHDLRIWGNCFYAHTSGSGRDGSSEPGIVMVSLDANANGLPDDPWYELAGSEHSNPLTRHAYSITYHRPVQDSPLAEDPCYIPWTDAEGAAGFLPKNRFHHQSYFPLWVDDESLSFHGTLLPPNAGPDPGTGYTSYFSYPWGYADNHPGDDSLLNSFDIDWAVDAFGNHVHLPGIDFVRVYTGVYCDRGWLGETSTEISRAQDLHITTP